MVIEPWRRLVSEVHSEGTTPRKPDNSVGVGNRANAPIEALLHERPERDIVCFVIDLFPRDGARPSDLETAAARKSDLERTELAKEKTGVWTGAFAINPVNGEKGPIWIADYVLATYGTGQRITVYNTIVTGPRQEGEKTVPKTCM